MNKIILLLILSYFFVACNSKPNVNHINHSNIVTNFIKDVRTLELDTNKNPINAFKNLANNLADKKTILTKDNIKSVLNDRKNYSSCVIVVANHTIVRINSLEDCQQSGSWKACMPTVAGYIKKGKLNYKANYMSNIIGKPDKQERIAYFFNDSKKILKEMKTLRIPELKDKEKMEINTKEIVDSITSNWESPKNLFLIDDYYSSIIIRAEARYDRSDGLNDEEMNWVENVDSLQWWVLPPEGVAKKVNVKQNLIYSTKLCGDYGNFYATELDYDPKDISLACLGNPPESWFKKGPECIISFDEATQLINAHLPNEFQNINNKIIITETTAGWDGYLNWCCPDEDNPLYENVDEMSIIEYRIPVNVSAQSKVTIGDAKAHIFGVEGSMQPSLKRDIDGDGILEVYWTGCQNFWTHNNKTFVSNVGDCCGC